jgi:hypothetical protein
MAPTRLGTTSKDYGFFVQTRIPYRVAGEQCRLSKCVGAYWFDRHYRVTRQFRIADAGVMLPAVGLQTTKFTCPLVT